MHDADPTRLAPILVQLLAEPTARRVVELLRAEQEASGGRVGPKTQDGSELGYVSQDALASLLEVSTETLRRWRHDRGLPFSKVGGCVFYRLSDVDAFLSRHVAGQAKDNT